MFASSYRGLVSLTCCSILYVDGIFVYIRLPKRLHVCLSDMSSIIVMYLLLFHIRVCSVKCAMRMGIKDC